MVLNQSDALFILDRLPDLVLLLDDEGAINYANRRSRQVLGNEDTLIGKQFRDLVDEKDLERLPRQLEDLVEWRSEQGFPWEMKIRLPNGQMQLVSGNAEILPTASESEAKIGIQGILITLRVIGEFGRKNIRRDLLIAAIEAADSSIVVADMTTEDFPLIYVNQGFLQLTGYEESEVIGKNCRFLQFYDDDGNRDFQQSKIEQLREAVTEGNSINLVIRNYRKDGSCFYNDLYLTPVYERERLIAFIGVQNDITERVLTRQKLIEREGIIKAAVENIQESVIVTEPGLDKDINQPKIIYVNQAFTKMTGYEPKEAIGKTPRILQGDLTDPTVLERLRKSLRERQSFRGETINYRKDGQPFIIEWNITSIQDKNKEVVYWVAAQHDVTKRRQLEKEVLEIQAREQERIARDLHDSVQQKLNVIVMVASLLQHQLNDKLTPQLKGFLDRLLESSHQASREVRNISHSLHPVNIEKSGLMTALQHLSTTTKEVFDVHCEFAYEQPMIIKDRNKATHLYRIVQEAVNNAVRHGKATQILIGLARVEDNKYALTISDNGIGISTEVLQNRDRGMGLNSMRYRAQFIEADLAIERGEEGGTVVTCIFDCRNISSKIDSPYNNESFESP